MNRAAVNMDEQVSLQRDPESLSKRLCLQQNLETFRYVPRSGILMEVGLSCLRNFHTDFHKGCTSSYAYQQQISTPHPPEPVPSFVVLILDILTAAEMKSQNSFKILALRGENEQKSCP